MYLNRKTNHDRKLTWSSPNSAVCVHACECCCSIHVCIRVHMTHYVVYPNASCMHPLFIQIHPYPPQHLHTSLCSVMHPCGTTCMTDATVCCKVCILIDHYTWAQQCLHPFCDPIGTLNTGVTWLSWTMVRSGESSVRVWVPVAKELPIDLAAWTKFIDVELLCMAPSLLRG